MCSWPPRASSVSGAVAARSLRYPPSDVLIMNEMRVAHRSVNSVVYLLVRVAILEIVSCWRDAQPMEVQVRVGRAHVWLSSLSLASEDGFLVLQRAVGRTGPTSQTVGCGSVEPSEALTPAADGTKRWRMTNVKWSSSSRGEQGSSSRLVVLLDEQHGSVPVEIVLFMVAKAGDGNPREKQRIAFIAATSLELSAKDVAAVDGSQEVVFKSPLNGAMGDVEVALRRVETQAKSGGMEDEATGFSVQWTSSEALEKDLKRKEEKRLEAEAKLLERLLKVEANARRVEELRAEAAEQLRLKRATTTIQRAYRGLRKRRREQRRRLRREQEEKERAKKEAVRAKVVARNQRRTQQLMEAWARPLAAESESSSRRDQEFESSTDMSDWVRRQQEATRHKLRETVARIEAEREAKLAELGCSAKRHARPWAVEEASHEDRHGSTKALSEGLVHAVRYLHVRK